MKRWLIRSAKALLILIVSVVILFGVIYKLGFMDRWIRRAMVTRLEQATGGRAEIGSFHFSLWVLHAHIEGLTVRGTETASEPPLFHADRVDVSIRILSFFRKQIALDALTVDRPEVTVRVDANGQSNLPTPKTHASKRPWRETLFDLRIGQLQFRDGSVTYNNRRTPLTLDGNNLQFSMHYDAPLNGADSYAGNLGWQQVRLAAKRDVPFRFDVSAKFLLHRDSFELDELNLHALHSSFGLRAELPSFAQSNWNLKYLGRLSLIDIRTIFRAPNTPSGDVDFSGQAHYAAPAATNGTGDWTGKGHYSTRNVALPYQYFHDKGLETAGDFNIANRKLFVPNLHIVGLGGTIDGTLLMNFKGLAFETKTRLRGMSVEQLLVALDNPNLPVRSLHWSGDMEADSVNTWNANFKKFRTTGEMRWLPSANPAPGEIPATARLEYDYRSDNQTFAVSSSEIATPTADIGLDGMIGKKDSALEVAFRADDLRQWDDFISAIRGTDSGTHLVAGRATWRGRIIGPLDGPAFVGHFQVFNAKYDNASWDFLQADMEYSPDAFVLKNAVVRRGTSSANLDLSLTLDGDWSFLPSDQWSLNSHFQRASIADLQAVFGTNYPASGMISGDLRAGGTRASPILDANFAVQNGQAMSLAFDRFSANLHWEQDQLRLTRVELVQDFGTIGGNLLYRPFERDVQFDLAGSNISLEKIGRIQTPSMPIAGLINFALRGSGPILSPEGTGTISISNLKLGTEMEGNFTGQLTSDGKNAHLTLASAPSAERLHGELTVVLSGQQSISGRLAVQQFDLDPFIVAGLHLSQITGQSTADGVFTLSGALRHPDSIEVDADIARISFNYEFVQLTNDQDIRIAYRRNEVRIQQAHLHGPDTDLQLGGTARFDRDRPIDFSVSGQANLRLLRGMIPDLDAQGRAEANVSIQGNMTTPRVTGQLNLKGASAHYADFPAGLSNITGNLLFDKSRLLFDKVTADSGGGHVTLSGNMTYGEGPFRYELTAATSVVRIRYPTGMSWLAGGTLELSGTSSAALVTGHVQVQRVLFGQGVDVASFFATASDTTPGPTSGSRFLQNLAFDVEGQTTPGARIEWSGAHVDIDGDVRLRGTWDRPVLLGNIHLLGGEMPFRGNTFELTRGDINFSNPFRLDPNLNVEATSTISQYQVAIDFSGPASHLELNYRSDPPLPDSDIVALLALGSPGESSGLRAAPGSGENYGATALLSEAISTGVGSRIEHLFGISSFRVDPFIGETATESNAAARVTIQEQVTHDLSITYSTNAATTNQYQLIQVQYTINRGLLMEFLRDINGTYGFDVKFIKHRK